MLHSSLLLLYLFPEYVCISSTGKQPVIALNDCKAERRSAWFVSLESSYFLPCVQRQFRVTDFDRTCVALMCSKCSSKSSAERCLS